MKSKGSEIGRKSVRPKLLIVLDGATWPSGMKRAASMFLGRGQEFPYSVSNPRDKQQRRRRSTGLAGYGIFEGDTTSYGHWVHDELTRTRANGVLELSWHSAPAEEYGCTDDYPNWLETPDWKLHYPSDDRRLVDNISSFRQNSAAVLKGRLARFPGMLERVVPLHLRMVAVGGDPAAETSLPDKRHEAFYRPPLMLANFLYDEYLLPVRQLPHGPGVGTV